MTKIHRDLMVDAKPERCFEFIADPSLAPLFISSLYSITPIEVEPRGAGNRWGFEYDPPSKYVWRSDPGTSTIDTTFSYRFQPEGEGTRISMDVEYEIPRQVLGGKIADRLVIERMNEHEADAAINNLKVLLEEA